MENAPQRRLTRGKWTALAILALGLTILGADKSPATRALQRFLARGRTDAVTSAEIACGYRVAGTDAGGPVEMPAGAVTNELLRRRGGFDWAFRVEPDNWRSAWKGGYLTGVTVLARGEVRPDVGTLYFPVPLTNGVSLLPEARWGMLSHAEEGSVFSHAVTTNGSLLLDWRNALVGRDPNSPTNLQMELFADGGFVWRTDGGSTSYLPVLPFDCSGGCGCGGCSVAGTYRLEGASFEPPPATCGCREGDDDDDNPLGPDPPPPVPSTGGISVSFSAKAVVFEDRHETAPDAWAERRSTRTVLAVRVDGGPDGGTFTLTPRNIGKLAPEGGTGPLSLPSGGTLAPGETYSATFECSGVEASGAEGDVAVSASFTDAGTGETQGDEATLTVVEVALRAAKTALENPCPNRHVYGIDETGLCLQRPSSPQVVWASSGGGIVSDSLPVAYRCPIRAERDGLTASVGSVSYCPKIEVKEPEGLACTAVGYLPANPLTGIGMALEVCVLPRTVSFEGLLLQEVAAPANATSPEWGVHSGFFADLAYQTRWYHHATWGAGQWIEVSQGNLFGRYDESRMMRWPRPWSNGNMTWAIPIAWKSGYPPYADEEGRLGVVYQSEWTMADDALTKTKHGQVLVLTESGQVFLNGEHNGTE